MEATVSSGITGATSTSDGGFNPFSHPNASTSSFTEVTGSGENCQELAGTFCEKILRIDSPRDKILIERAHRIGGMVHNKKSTDLC